MRTIIMILVGALGCSAKQQTAPVKPATVASHPHHSPIAQR